MNEIEKKALALLNGPLSPYGYLLEDHPVRVLCRAIEAHEAFRQEVSDAVEHYASRWPTNARRDIFMSQFASFVIAKPDLLVEALQEWWDADGYASIETFRAALAARGLEIREIEK
jgi:hypothetical protein